MQGDPIGAASATLQTPAIISFEDMKSQAQGDNTTPSFSSSMRLQTLANGFT
jgi:hypothetical protein